MMREVKEIWQVLAAAVRVARIRQPRVGVSELIEEWVDHGVNSRQALRRRIFKQP